MIDSSLQNKKAWEYNAYEFWVTHVGTPEENARKLKSAPSQRFKRYARYFDTFAGVKVANICGSCGKQAIPLALLGADVTIFDISEDNRRYALETAGHAGVTLRFEVGDVLEIDLVTYGQAFDVVFMEGGVLHYFHDINRFIAIMHALLKPGGKMILSDFHPFTKISDAFDFQQPTMSYFSTDVFEGEMAHARFFDGDIRERMPRCVYRKYTLSEIINAVIESGLFLRRFDEHPAWTNPDVPGEFTIIAAKPPRAGELP